MGFQDALYQLDINFDSEQAVRFADESMEAISYYAILASAELAKERGPYETYKGSKWDRGILPVRHDGPPGEGEGNEDKRADGGDRWTGPRSGRRWRSTE